MTWGGQSWAVVVPVKRLTRAKSRLDVEPAARVELALAMAADTVAACLAARTVRAVVVVSDDERAAGALRALGAHVVADEPDAGLNPALVHGAVEALRAQPEAAVAALSSDLPALSPAALDALLAAAAQVGVGCVADAAGTGTTMLTARSVGAFRPAFGGQSRQRHVDDGAFDLTTVADPRLRRDVDTFADLMDALRLGCGPATTAVASALDECAVQ